MRFLNKRIETRRCIGTSRCIGTRKRSETRNHIEQVTPGAVYVNSRDQGSAAVEFVVLTLPLFVPFALYLAVVNTQSQVAFDAHNLARQVARAFVTSPTEDLTSPRTNVVVSAFTNSVLKKHGITSEPQIKVICAASPCLTPGSEVEVIVNILDNSMKPSGYLRFMSTSPTRVIAQDTQVVDTWRST